MTDVATAGRAVLRCRMDSHASIVMCDPYMELFLHEAMCCAASGQCFVKFVLVTLLYYAKPNLMFSFTRV
jgi:hypothetical protein